MRILQLIDSLEAGGAERMAVNYANELSEEIVFSALVTTRKEGALKNQLVPKVDYLFLNKKRKVDFKAILKLRGFVLKNQLDLIHAHSSSFFLAVLVKLTLPKIKIIWHDHYGNSDFLEKRPKFILQLASYFFCGIIVVNDKLESWSMRYLHCKNAIYLPNFVAIEKNTNSTVTLEGEDGKRILCLANLREQKNHFLLLDIAEKLLKSHPDWSFHLVGKDFQDAYSKALKKAIIERKLHTSVFLYDAVSDVSGVLDQVQIGVLTSHSEGLPVALLEYGMNKKAVVLTNVGQNNSVIENTKNGYVVPSNDAESFYRCLVELIENESTRLDFGVQLQQRIINHFSANSVVNKYLHWLRTTIVYE